MRKNISSLVDVGMFSQSQFIVEEEGAQFLFSLPLRTWSMHVMLYKITTQGNDLCPAPLERKMFPSRTKHQKSLTGEKVCRVSTATMGGSAGPVPVHASRLPVHASRLRVWTSEPSDWEQQCPSLFVQHQFILNVSS